MVKVDTWELIQTKDDPLKKSIKMKKRFKDILLISAFISSWSAVILIILDFLKEI